MVSAGHLRTRSTTSGGTRRRGSALRVSARPARTRLPCKVLGRDGSVTIGVGTPRGLQGRVVSAVWALIIRRLVGLWGGLERVLAPFLPDWPSTASPPPYQTFQPSILTPRTSATGWQGMDGRPLLQRRGRTLRVSSAAPGPSLDEPTDFGMPPLDERPGGPSIVLALGVPFPCCTRPGRPIAPRRGSRTPHAGHLRRKSSGAHRAYVSLSRRQPARLHRRETCWPGLSACALRPGGQVPCRSGDEAALQRAPPAPDRASHRWAMQKVLADRLLSSGRFGIQTVPALPDRARRPDHLRLGPSPPLDTRVLWVAPSHSAVRGPTSSYGSDRPSNGRDPAASISRVSTRA